MASFMNFAIRRFISKSAPRLSGAPVDAAHGEGIC